MIIGRIAVIQLRRMNEKVLLNRRLSITIFISIGIWGLLIWNHFNGGVPSHHILNREDLPQISNWWGGLILPLLTWILLYRVTMRIVKRDNGTKAISNFPLNVIYNFITAATFGVLLSLFFTFGYSNLSGNMIQIALVLGLFFPIYRSEFILGFVIGMTYTFGAILPMAVAIILACLSAGLYLYIRPGFIFIYSKMMK